MKSLILNRNSHLTKNQSLSDETRIRDECRLTVAHESKWPFWARAVFARRKRSFATLSRSRRFSSFARRSRVGFAPIFDAIHQPTVESLIFNRKSRRQMIIYGVLDLFKSSSMIIINFWFLKEKNLGLSQIFIFLKISIWKMDICAFLCAFIIHIYIYFYIPFLKNKNLE